MVTPLRQLGNGTTRRIGKQVPPGPFDRWPTGKGFDYFYGFQGGETSQYYPQLFENTRPVEPSKTPEQGYTLNEDLANHALAWLREHQSVAPDKPWFMYVATGAMHAPHQVPQSYIAPFKGKFEMGWDNLREAIYENEIVENLCLISQYLRQQREW